MTGSKMPNSNWTEQEKKVLEQDWTGKCYSAAIAWVREAKEFDWDVVHGTVYSGDLERRIDHAWCERGNTIVDLAMPPEVRVLDRDFYYKNVKPEVSRLYSAKEALMLSVRNGHHGPWNDSEQLPPDEPGILDHPAISGAYLFPQPRCVDDPFMIEVDGAELACYRKIIDPGGFTLVHFHGNGECVADYVPTIAEVFESFGLNTLFIEYREYGDSTGKAQLVAMLGDGEAAMRAAGLEPEKVIVFGRSIGSLYAIELADRQRNIAGLIIESGIANPAERFLASADLDSAAFNEADVLAEVKLNFDHELKLGDYENPLLILHTENDGLIEISHAQRNYEWAGSEQKQLVRFPYGNHNTILPANVEKYLDAIRTFVEGIVQRD